MRKITLFITALSLMVVAGILGCSKSEDETPPPRESDDQVESQSSRPEPSTSAHTIKTTKSESGPDTTSAPPQPIETDIEPPRFQPVAKSTPAQPPVADKQKQSLRIAVASHPEDEGSEDVRMALEKLLRKKNYTVYDFSQLEGVRHKEFLASLKTADADSLKKLREDLQIDVAIDCRTKTRERGQIDLAGQAASNYASKLECRLIDLETAEVFESVEAEGQSASMVEQQGREKARQQAAIKAAPKLLSAIHTHQSQ